MSLLPLKRQQTKLKGAKNWFASRDSNLVANVVPRQEHVYSHHQHHLTQSFVTKFREYFQVPQRKLICKGKAKGQASKRCPSRAMKGPLGCTNYLIVFKWVTLNKLHGEFFLQDHRNLQDTKAAYLQQGICKNKLRCCCLWVNSTVTSVASV